MNTDFCRAVVVFALLCIFATPLKADFFDVTASADVRVLSFFPDSNEGNGGLLSLFNNPGNIQRTYLYFDLSSLVGLTVLGDATLNLRATGDANNLVTNGALYRAFGSWDESSITWNNQPGPLGAPLDSISGTYTQSVTWDVPQATIQGWLNTPVTNVGFVLLSDPGSTLTFHSTENVVFASPPRLIFNSIPEPTAALVLGGAFIAFFGRRSRRPIFADIRY